jgi:hypothetical protein
MTKQRQHCSIANQECLCPAGQRVYGGHWIPRPSITWECPRCGNPACKNCRVKVGKATVCYNCESDEKEDQ